MPPLRPAKHPPEAVGERDQAPRLGERLVPAASQALGVVLDPDQVCGVDGVVGLAHPRRQVVGKMGDGGAGVVGQLGTDDQRGLAAAEDFQVTLGRAIPKAGVFIQRPAGGGPGLPRPCWDARPAGGRSGQRGRETSPGPMMRGGCGQDRPSAPGRARPRSAPRGQMVAPRPSRNFSVLDAIRPAGDRFADHAANESARGEGQGLPERFQAGVFFHSKPDAGHEGAHTAGLLLGTAHAQCSSSFRPGPDGEAGHSIVVQHDA